VEQFIHTEGLVVLLLLIVSLVAVVAKRVPLPYTVILVVVGLFLTFEQGLRLEVTPQIILGLFVPPLVFEAAFHIDFERLRRNWLPIVVLAVPGVIATTLIIALLIWLVSGLPFTTGLVFGSLIAATDPVAVVALFRQLGAPKKLTTLVEGESLFNDGTSIVVFGLILAAVTGNGNGPVTFNLLGAIVSFVVVAGGGIGLGVGLGWLTCLITARLDNYLIETSFTTVLAFGSYLLAEEFKVGGVLAVVAAGIVFGNFGTKNLSPTTKIGLFNFWEYLAFVTNSLVFLLIGLAVNVPEISKEPGAIAVAIASVLISRAVVVYGLSFLVNFSKQKVSLAYQHVLVWGGLRGALSLALALTLPVSYADRTLVLVMTYGVVLVLLLVQGATMNLLLQRLGLVGRNSNQLEFERGYGKLVAALAARDRVREMYENKTISQETWQQLSPELEREVEAAAQVRQELLNKHPDLQAEERATASQEGLRAQRVALTDLQNKGVISEAVYEKLVSEIDETLVEDSSEAEEIPQLPASHQVN